MPSKNASLRSQSAFGTRARSPIQAEPIQKELQLDRAVAELVNIERAASVFGFFAGSPDWSSSRKYRWFFERGVARALCSGQSALRAAGTIFNRAGKTVSLQGLGRVLDLFLKSDLSLDSLADAISGATMPKGVEIGYSSLMLKT